MELGAVYDNGYSSTRDGAGPSKTPRNPLTDAQKEQLKRHGQCFYCKQAGHIAFYCPNQPGNEKGAGKAPAR